MRWVKIHDLLDVHPKMQQLSGDAAWTHVRALLHCARLETNGFIDRRALRLLTDHLDPHDPDAPEANEIASRLVEVGLWLLHDAGWLVHDWLDWHGPTADREAVSEARREAGRKGGLASADARRAKQASKPAASNEANGSKQRSRLDKKRVDKSTSSATPPAAEESTPAEPKQPTAQQAMFQAVADACGWDTRQLTKDASGRVGAAVKQLSQLSATPDDVHARANAYRRKFTDMPLTPQALTGNWASLNGRPVKPPQCPTCGDTNHYTPKEHQTQCPNYHIIESLNGPSTR